MNILTTENARDGMVVSPQYKSDYHYTLRLGGSENFSAYALPLGDTPDLMKTRLFLGDTDCGKWHIVEDAPEPPLVALGPDSTDQLGIAPQDQPSRTLQAVSGLCDEAIGFVEVIEWDATVEEAVRVFAKKTHDCLIRAQALIGNKADSVLTKPDSESDAADRLSEIIAGIADLHAQMLDTYNKLYGTGEVAEIEAEVDHA